MGDIPVVSVVGYSGSGKTTFLEKLIAELAGRGYRVGTVKHTSHDVQFDRPGKDTWRHAKAGAEVIALAAPGGVCLVVKQAHPSPEEVVSLIKGVDLVITEGYKRGKWPKLLVYRRGCGPVPDPLPGQLLAVVSDAGPDYGGPVFNLEDATGVADLLEREIIGPKSVS